jgi:hypothetical protein
MRKWSWLLVLLFLPVSAYSDGNNYGAASYLQQGVGGRANGMGDAYVAVADDATSAYWNPAGLAQMGLYMYEVGAEYAFLPNDMSSSFLSYAFQWPDVGSFSVGWINFGIGNIEGRDAAGLVTNDFSSTENTVILSYGRKAYEWVKGLSLGANLKFLQQGIGDYSAVGHGLDLGVQWQPFMYWDHTIGLNVQNLFQKLYWKDSTQDNSLVNAKLGFALRFLPSDEQLYYDHLVTAVDLEFSEYQRFKFHAGAEYWFINSLAVRAGVNGANFTVGASFRPEYYQIDYAFIYDTSELGAHQHRLSLELRLATNYEQTANQSAAVVAPLPEQAMQPPLTPAATSQATPGVEPQATPAPTAAATPATTMVPIAAPTIATTPVITSVLNRTLTPEQTSVPTPAATQIPTLEPIKSDGQAPSALSNGTETRIKRLNAITIDPLGFIAISGLSGVVGELEYERAIDRDITVAVKGLLTYFGSSTDGGLITSSYIEYGGGLTIRYFPMSDNDVPNGLWLGPIAKFQIGKERIENPYFSAGDFFDHHTYTYGGEIGYKWTIGKDGWFVISPYIGFYEMIYTDSKLADFYQSITNEELAIFYTSLGVNVGIAF